MRRLLARDETGLYVIRVYLYAFIRRRGGTRALATTGWACALIAARGYRFTRDDRAPGGRASSGRPRDTSVFVCQNSHAAAAALVSVQGSHAGKLSHGAFYTAIRVHMGTERCRGIGAAVRIMLCSRFAKTTLFSWTFREQCCDTYYILTVLSCVYRRGQYDERADCCTPA